MSTCECDKALEFLWHWLLLLDVVGLLFFSLLFFSFVLLYIILV